MSSNTTIDIAKSKTPNHFPSPDTPSSINNDNHDDYYSFKDDDSPTPASPVASPLPPPHLSSALGTLVSLGAQAAIFFNRPAPQSSDADALIEEGSELNTESTADSLRLPSDSAAAPTHGNSNLLGRVSTAPTTTEESLASPARVARYAERAEDDALRPLPPTRYDIHPVVYRPSARSLKQIETRADRPLCPEAETSQLGMFGNALAGFVGRIPGVQTFGNLWHAIPSSQNILHRLGIVPQARPSSPLPQIQNPIPALNRPEYDSAFIAINIAENTTGSDVSSTCLPIIPERTVSVADAVDIPTRSASARTPVSTYLQLGLAHIYPRPTQLQIATPDFRAPQPEQHLDQRRDVSTYRNIAFQFFASMHPEYRPEGSALTPARVTITHSGSSEHRESAQADPDILRQSEPVELLPLPIMNAVQNIIGFTSAGAISLAGYAGGALGQAANRAATSFMEEFKSEPAAQPQPATVAASATAQGVACRSGTPLHVEQTAVVPPAVEAVSFAQSVGDAVGQAAGQAARRAGIGFIAALTGTTASLTAASPAASAAATPQGFFSQIFTGLRNAATKKFTELRFAGIALTLAQKVDGMEDSPVKTQLNEMLAAIGKFQNGKISQDSLEETLTRIMNGQNENGQQIRDILHIHINGFELPIRTEAGGTAQQTLDALQAAHPRPPETTQTAEQHQISVAVRQARLVANISTMAPLNLVNEWLCGGLLSKEKIAEILGTNRNANNYNSVVKNAFYAELNKLSILRRWAAKFTYWAFSGLSSIILSSFIQGIIEKVQSSVKVETSQRQQDIHNSVIRNINGGLTAYNEAIDHLKALRRAHSDDLTINDPDSMLGDVLAKPRYNGRETKETLYDKAIDKAVDEILPPLNWTKSLKDGIRKLPGWAQALLFPLTFIARGVVAATEWASEFIIRSVIRTVVKYTKILDTIIDLSVDQVSRNGYTHAINKLILQQLKLIGEALNKDDSEASSTSLANKQELRKLAKELFKTLETQRREGQVDTDAATTLENFKRSVYQLTSDLSADAIALIIDQAKNIILDPTMIAMRQDTLLEALNAAIESNSPDSTEAMIALENEIMRESDIILNKALKKIIHTTLAHKPAEVQEACNCFTKKLRDKAAEFAAQLQDRQESRSEYKTSIGEFAVTMQTLLNEAQNDPLLEGSAATLEQLITRIVNIVTSLSKAAQPSESELRPFLDSLNICIDSIPEIIHVDTQIVDGVMKKMESITSKVAYQGGKEFFNEAWKLLRKKPVWRFAAHRAMLSFVKS